MQNTFDKNELNAHVNVSVRLLYQRRRLKMKKTNIAEIKRENKHENKSKQTEPKYAEASIYHFFKKNFKQFTESRNNAL